MTADLSEAAEKVRAEADDLADMPTDRAFPHPWLVVRQFTYVHAERVVCSHRLEVGAEWCARRWTKRHRGAVTTGHYTVRRRAES